MVPEGFWEVTEKAICYLCGKPYEKPLRLDATSRFSCKGCDYSLHISDVYQVEKQKTGKASKEKLREIFEREADIRNRDIEDLSKQIESLRNQKEKYDILRKRANRKVHHYA